MKSFGLLLAYSAHAQREVDSAEERYFFTTVTTTTTTTVTATTLASDQSCWKCDEMSYDDCATNGYYVKCGLGEHESCFYEMREVTGQLTQLCTGCKETKACENLQKENFVDVTDPLTDMLNDQCKPR